MDCSPIQEISCKDAFLVASSIQMTSQLAHKFTKPPRCPGLATVLRNMLNVIYYMLQLERDCCNNNSKV